MKDKALAYHSSGRPGKIAIQSTKPCKTQEDLSLAYSPGVAEPCLKIAEREELSFEYTARGNLVAVISNGTAVLGLGNIGPAAAKPVMEGKSVLFKRFADVDAFDLEVEADDPDLFIEIVKSLEPTFGGINLEDIKAPDCFYIEETLSRRMNIPVFHDDQHGTAIITSAALLNALELVNKKIEDVKVVFSGAGAAAIACAKMFMSLGMSKEQMTLCDRNGVIYMGRPNTEPRRAEFARHTDIRSLGEAFKGADIFIGLSSRGLVDPDMLKDMAKNPIVFALANPDPEISYDEAKAVRTDVIVATGRSDYPNQVNNVLGFPFMFRGALDVSATSINDAMKLAACRALAKLAKEPVPQDVCDIYGGAPITFGPDYIIPKPFDARVLTWVAPEVAKAAMESGVARRPIADFDAYRAQLKKRLSETA